MSNYNINRTGQADNAGDPDALFLTVWAGEVLNAFAERNVALSRSTVRTIPSGTTAQFPATWKAGAAYHTPGVELTGSLIPNNERLISIDDLLVSDVALDILDNAKAHADYRGEYTKQTGAALARAMDKNLQQVGLLAARAAATVAGGNGGTSITDADALTQTVAGIDSLVGSIFDIAQNFDEKDVPADERFVFLKPQEFYNLISLATRPASRDYGAPTSGDFAAGTVQMIAGLQIVSTNNLPQSNITTGPAAYQGDFSNVAALGWHRSAVGTVKLLDLATEMEYSVRHQAWLIVSKYAVGHGILRPEAAAEVVTA